MTREEAINKYIIPALQNTWNEKKCKEIIEAFNQQPCEDEYIKVPKKALKYRTAGMVAYNAEWLKDHFDIERAVICGEQESCVDAISREWLKTAIHNFYYGLKHTPTEEDIQAYIDAAPFVNPQEPKTGHWINIGLEGKIVEQIVQSFTCSECGAISVFRITGGKIVNGDLCPNCGCRMFEPQERSE